MSTSTRDLHKARDRSRSPTKHSYSRRSRSPHTHRHHSSSKHSKPSAPVPLPFQAPRLSKHDFEEYKPLFGLYLDIQKHLVLEELPEEEVKGRWKSFLGKWNRGDLAEGWYDPATLQKAQGSAASASASSIAEPERRLRGSPQYGSPAGAEESSEEDIVGPTLPAQDISIHRSNKRAGPAIPTLQDLELRRELNHEDSLTHRQTLQHDRLYDRKIQKGHLDDLVPRAEPGSKDRILEKKREKADSNRAFASAKTEAGGVEEVPENDLLGGEDGIEGFKRQKKEMERKKNDREIRKEEILRARNEEREERLREYRAKEEKTMAGLVALARARFG